MLTLVSLVVVRIVSPTPRVFIFATASIVGAKGQIASPLLRSGDLATFLLLLVLDIIIFAQVLGPSRSDIPEIILIIAALLAVFLLLLDKES